MTLTAVILTRCGEGYVVCGPEICLVRLQCLKDFFDGVAFPGSADFRVMFQISLIDNAQQRVQQAAVSHVDFRRFDLTLAEILEPWWQLPHHEYPAVNAGFSWYVLEPDDHAVWRRCPGTSVDAPSRAFTGFADECRKRVAAVADFVEERAGRRIVGHKHGGDFSSGRRVAEATENFAAPAITCFQQRAAAFCFASQGPTDRRHR